MCAGWVMMLKLRRSTPGCFCPRAPVNPGSGGSRMPLRSLLISSSVGLPATFTMYVLATWEPARVNCAIRSPSFVSSSRPSLM